MSKAKVTPEGVNSTGGQEHTKEQGHMNSEFQLDNLVSVNDKDNSSSEILSNNPLLNRPLKIVTADELLLNSMDLFMFINKTNDEYLDIDDLKKFIEFLNTKKLQKHELNANIKEILKQSKGAISYEQFVQIIKELKMDHKEACDLKYHDKFGGISNIVFRPCRNCCCRSIRKKMVKSNLEELWWKKNPQQEDEQRQKSKMKKKNTSDGVMLAMKAQSSFKRLAEKGINIHLLFQLYYHSIEKDNELKKSYKIVSAWLFISLISSVLISYSSQLNIYLDRGYYQPQELGRFFPFKVIFLTFIGSSYCILLEALYAFETFFSLIGLIGGRGGLQYFDNLFTTFHQQYMGGITTQQMKNQYEQRVLAHLMFQSIPDLVLKILIMKSDLDVDGFVEDELQIIYFSIILTCANVLIEMYMIYTAAISLEENPLAYGILCMKAKQGWIPFCYKIQSKDLRRSIDYSQIKCYLPFVTHKIGYYQTIQFQFDNKTLQTLSEDILQAQKFIERKEENEKQEDFIDNKNLDRMAILRSVTVAKPNEKHDLEKLENSSEQKSIDYQNDIEAGNKKMLPEKQEDQNSVKINQKLRKYNKQIGLTQILRKFDVDDIDYINNINIGKSLNFVSINMLIHLMNQIQDEDSFNLQLHNADWETLIVNAIHYNHLPGSNEPFTKTTIKNVNFLTACIDNERENNWMLEGAFNALLAHGCDPNIVEKSTNLPLIIYAMKKNKKRALKLFQKYIEKINWKRLILDVHQNVFKKKQNKIIDKLDQLVNKDQQEKVKSSYILKSQIKDNNESWLQICIDNEQEQDVCDSILIIASEMSTKNQQIWLDQMNILAHERQNNTKEIEKTEEDYKEFNTQIEKIKQISSKHRNLLESVIFKSEIISSINYHSLNTAQQNEQSLQQDKDEEIKVKFVKVLDQGHYQKKKQEWLLKDLMEELINDECDINIAVNKIPLVLYAFQTGKMQSFKLMMDKGLDWKRFIANCKADGTIEKTEGTYYYNVKDINGTNWMKHIINNEPSADEKVKDMSQFFLLGLLKELFKDGYDPNGIIYLRKKAEGDYWETCSLIKYAEDQKKYESFRILQKKGAQYMPEDRKDQGLNLSQINKNQHMNQAISKELDKFEDIVYQAQKNSNTEQHNLMENQNVEIIEVTSDQLNQYNFTQDQKFSLKMNSEFKSSQCTEIDKQSSLRLRKLQKPELKDTEVIEDAQPAFSNSFDFFDFCIETMAFGDLITDVLFLYLMYNSVHNAWFTLSLCAMIAPFFVSYVPYLNFRLEKIYTDYKNKNRSCWLTIVMVIALTPLVILYFFIIDLVNQINAIIIFPILSLLNILTCNKIKVIQAEMTSNYLDKMFRKITKMTLLEVRGFRRLRLISQLMFESVPQIILQGFILRYAYLNDVDEIYGVSIYAIIISIIVALLHFILEVISLILESKACQTYFFHYCLICYNGRLGWVPFIEMITKQSIQNISKQQKEINLDYDNLVGSLMNKIEMRLEYTFTNETALKLIRALRNLEIAKIKHKELKIKMKIGKCFNNVDFDKLIDLIKESHGRVLLDIRDIDTAKLFLKSVKYNIDDTAIERLIVYLKSVHICKHERQRNRKFHIEINSTIMEPKNKVTEFHFFNLMKESYHKAQIIFSKDLDVSTYFNQTIIIDLHQKKVSKKETAQKWVYLFHQLSNQEDLLNMLNIKEQFPTENFCSCNDITMDDINQISSYFIKTIIEDDNEMIIYHMFQIQGLLDLFDYGNQLYNYMYENMKLDQFMKFAKYDSNVCEKHHKVLESYFKMNTQQSNLFLWVKAVLRNTDDPFNVYMKAINRYFRYKVSRNDDNQLQEQIKELNELNIIQYPSDSKDLIEYDLSNFEEKGRGIKIVGHQKAKNQREEIQQLLNCQTEKSNKWLVRPLAHPTNNVKGWFHLIFEVPIYIRGFGLRSASNFPIRDPHSFELLAKIQDVDLHQEEKEQNKKRMYGDIDVTGFTMLSKNDIDFDKKDRWQVVRFQLGERSCIVKEIKMLITSLRFDVEQDDNKDWMQIGQFILYI